MTYNRDMAEVLTAYECKNGKSAQVAIPYGQNPTWKQIDKAARDVEFCTKKQGGCPEGCGKQALAQQPPAQLLDLG
jgi:hypothetical protein